MKTIMTREAAPKRAPRMPNLAHKTPTHRQVQTEVWPGLTRAQLREIVIDQIG